jgi:predicted dehydrogenase
VDELRVGFLGAGLIATFHSKMLRRAPVVRAGVFDPDRERAEAFAAASGHIVCDSEDEVFDGCDAVYVCTWTSEHPRLVAEAARRGLHVFCEKPLATNLADAEQMLEVVQRAGVTHQVGLILRRSPAYAWARRLIDDPDAGAVMAVVFRDDQFIPIQGHYASTWRRHRELAGAGTLLEHSIHDVDMLRFLVGDIASVSARQNNFHGHEGIEDVVSASIGFVGGATGTLLSVWHDNLARPSLRRVEVFCERRFVVIEGDDWFGPVSWTDSDGSVGALEGEALVDAVAPLIDGDANPDGAFVRACLTGTDAWPDFVTAIDAHRVVDAMYRSAEAGGASVNP